MAAITSNDVGVYRLVDTITTYQDDLSHFAVWLAGKAAEWGDLPEPYAADIRGEFFSDSVRRLKFDVMCESADDLAAVGRLMAAGAPIGSVRKEYDDLGRGYVRITRSFGTVELEAWAHRDEVCEAIVDGVETVEIPDPEAPMVMVERPRIRWECKPVFAQVAS